MLKLPGAQPLEMVELLKKCLVDEKPKTFADCVLLARQHFEDLFVNQILQLLYNFPRSR